MHKGDTIPGLLVCAFGLAFLIATLLTPNLTIQSTTSDGVPGAGFFPYLLGSAVTLLGAALFVRGLRQKGTVQYIKLDPEIQKNLKILLLTVVGLVVFLAFWQLTHLFTVGVLLFCLYLNRLFERPWKFNAIYSVVFTVFIYAVFTLGFSIQFGA